MTYTDVEDNSVCFSVLAIFLAKFQYLALIEYPSAIIPKLDPPSPKKVDFG